MPAYDAHKNFAYSLVATAPSPATSGTSLIITTGDASKFPVAPFNATVWPSGVQPTLANAEIVRVTAGPTGSDTFTITRAQEGTIAQSIAIGWQIAATITAKLLSDLEAASSGTLSFTADDSMKRVTITDANATTTSKIQVTVRRPDVTEAADPGWFYIANVVTQANGSFDVAVVALDWDSPVTANQNPNETITLVYRLWS